MPQQFTRESEMVASASRWLRARRLVVKPEFVTPWGICDLVGARLNKTNVMHRLRCRQTSQLSSITRTALLLKIPEVETGKSACLKRMVRDWAPAMPEEIVTRELRKLEADGFVRRDPLGRWQRLNGWMPLHDSLVAVELKLSRIDEALHQARQNLGFADQSFVGLPSDVAKRVKATSARWSEFFDDGIGLLSVGDSHCRVLIPAGKSRQGADSAIQLYCVDKFWRDHVRGS